MRRSSLIRQPITALQVVIGCLLSFCCQPTQQTGGSPAGSSVAADLILRGSPVYTMNAVRSWAETVAIRGNTIVYVGPDAGSEAYFGAQTKVVQLSGGMILPGFQDIHIHAVSGGVAYRACALYELSTKEEYLAAIAEYAQSNPDIPWIRGGGWSIDAFAPSGIPDKRLLDEIVDDRPVFLRDIGGHAVWLNSKALEAAGIDHDTPDPDGGRIDRDPQTGEPIGSLQDAAMNLIFNSAPPYAVEEMADGLSYALQMLNGYGITSFQDANVQLSGSQAKRSLAAYRALDERAELTARVVAALWWEADRGEEQVAELVAAREQHTRGNLRATSVKIMQDGVIEARTAALLEPYVGSNSETGIPMIQPEALKRIVTALDQEGFQVHFHAIGDAAIRQSLDAIEAARSANGPRDARHHISHLELFHPSDIPRFRQLGVIANFQPLWAQADELMVKFTLPLLRGEQARWLYPIGSLLQSGAVVAFGSDWSVSTANPLEEMEVAVTRMSPGNAMTEPFIAEERIGLQDALAAFTINAAYVNFQEDSTGSIEPGKLADLIVLDRNLFDIEPSQISEARVLLTLLDGVPVYGELDAFGM